VTANKNYFDHLYSILQEKSHLEVTPDGEHIRYLEKKEVTAVKMAEWIKASRQTATKRFEALKSLQLIREDEENGRYILTYLERSLCTLVP
jgi:Fic family protein